MAEVPASGPARRAFVEIRPATTTADSDARRDGWTRADRDRRFTLDHWDHEADQITGFDYDLGAILARITTVAAEARLTAALEA